MQLKFVSLIMTHTLLQLKEEKIEKKQKETNKNSTKLKLKKKKYFYLLFFSSLRVLDASLTQKDAILYALSSM